MTRRHTDPVDVLRRGEDPARFLWHDRLYVVREVLDHWVEAGEWWPGAARRHPTVAPGAPTRSVTATVGHAVTGHEVWRVEAGAGRLAPLGVYDLYLDTSLGSWTLARALD